MQTHLYNLASALYRNFEALTEKDPSRGERILKIIAELVDISEYSREFPVCLWAYGDSVTREILAESLALMPSPQQMDHVLKLPHMLRHERERVVYRYSNSNASLKRYRQELADYNRRRKLAAKNAQRGHNG